MDSVSRVNGGIFEAERRLQQTLHTQFELDVEVLGLTDTCTELDRAAWVPLVPETYPVKGPQAFGYSPGLADALSRSDADLASFVGLWKFPSLAGLRWANQTGKPFLVSPHGMLDLWALRNSRTRKQIAAWLFQNAQLKKATCLRALCAAEAVSFRAYGLKNPICIIPNGIDLPDQSEEGLPPSFGSPFPADRTVLLYLGRLHPKKGLGALLEAWNRVRQNHGKDWILAIAGWDQGGHEAELKQHATDLGLPWAEGDSQSNSEASLVFLGSKFGQAKAAVFSNCDAFILPSLSEGLPMVILEAWAYGKTVVMTTECNLPEGFSSNAALRIDPTTVSIVEGLSQLMRMTPAEREMMGKHGLALVRERFSWPKVASEMESVYQWMLGGGAKPGCMTTS